MGLLDRLFGRSSQPEPRVTPAAPAQARPRERTVTIRRPGGIVETRVVTNDGVTFDDWLAEMERKSAPEDSPEPVQRVVVDEATLSIVNLRGLAAIRARIVGSANWIEDADRSVFGGVDYLLIREPSNTHDHNAIAVYGRGRKIGYVSAAKAAALSPILDRLRFDAFRISGASVTENSSRLWADLPSVPALRAFAETELR